MAINILTTVQENLHYPPLHKIDPNTQEVINDGATDQSNDFSQAVLPAVLTGLYKYSSTDNGAQEILRGDFSTNWVAKIFEENKTDIIDKIADYVHSSKLSSNEHLNEIATEAVKVIRENIPPESTPKDVKIFFSNQLKNILPYLPAALHVGDLLNDTTLDDNTNKMEGPVSSLMHAIGSAFSTPESKKDNHP